MASSLFQNPQITKIKEMMNLLKSSNNPQAFMQNMISQNPQMKQVMDYVNQNGGDPKTAFYNLAQKQGVNPEEVLSLFK